MIKAKSQDEINLMKEGGKKLAQVKQELKKMLASGISTKTIDRKACELIYSLGAEPSFPKVPGYKWATCININEGVVHGIPGSRVLSQGDIVSVDIGVFYKGFHTDSAFTKAVGEIPNATLRFLEAGERALNKAVLQVKADNYISDISKAIQKEIESAGLSPVRDLTGHGVGRDLHEEPFIPCFWDGEETKDEKIPEGATLAIEVIYTAGSPKLKLAPDGWTISTQDGKIAGLFEETVAVVGGKPQVLTA